LKKILVVDDEPDIRQIVSYNLEKEGYQVLQASDGASAIEIAKTEKPDLMVLDVMMPNMDGIEVCQEIKSIPELQHIIICFLTARSEDYSQIAGLESGGDDYISKPVKPKILIARIKALFRRNGSVKQIDSSEEGIFVDLEKYQVIYNGDAVNLPKKEFELLALLFSKPGKVFDRGVILSRIWGDDVVVSDRTIDVHIRKLREKFGSEHFVTIKGVGYKFEK
jgi:two-component system alkaline phosphatase synthesis response regulator PhoP